MADRWRACCFVVEVKTGEAMPDGVRRFWIKAAAAGSAALRQGIEAVRATMFATLGAAAPHLPRSWALALAAFFQSLLAASPVGVRARRMMRDTFPAKKDEIAARAARWLGRPFRDHVLATRIRAGREDVRGWTIEMRGAPELLADPDASFIIATGHFSREAMTVLYLPWIMKHRLATVMAPIPAARTPRAARVRLQMRVIREGIDLVRHSEIDIIDVGDRSFLVRLLRHLREPGGAVMIASDAAWDAQRAGAFTRPFAGFAAQTFALGTARLARLSQRPVMTCVPFLDGDKRVVMEWSPVIPAPARGDCDADIRITNEILDWIERRIGERPDQYVQSFGHERRWSPVARCWTGGESSEKPPRARAPKRPARTAKSLH